MINKCKYTNNSPLLLPLQKRCSIDCNPLLSANKTCPLRSSCLYGDSANLHPHNRGKGLPHKIYIRSNLWPLKQKRTICIHKLITPLLNHRIGAFQENFAIYALKLSRTIRKMLPDISQGQSPQERIAKRVNKNISVRMCHTPLCMLYPNASQP